MEQNILSRAQLKAMPKVEALSYLDGMMSALSFKQYMRVLSWIEENNG